MSKVILHTEASLGFGGQEIRILKESIGMRKRGMQVVIAASPGAQILNVMKKEGFATYEVPFQKRKALTALFRLRKIIKQERVSIINTHSSLDAWLAGIAGKLFNIPVIRTRHLSSPIKKGLNSFLLYNFLADATVTTCEEIVSVICNQAKISQDRCKCIATGLDPEEVKFSQEEVDTFRKRWGVQKEDILIGTLCVLRSWKGIYDFLKAAYLLKDHPHLKWMIVGTGPSEEKFKREAKELGIEENVIFTGHLMPPYVATEAMDIFVLLSTANEGISQATIQAAYLKKPLITTETGGLKEVCISHVTGFIVPKNCPEEVVKAIKKLEDRSLRERYGENGRELVLKKFTLARTLNEMISIYKRVAKWVLPSH